MLPNSHRSPEIDLPPVSGFDFSTWTVAGRLVSLGQHMGASDALARAGTEHMFFDPNAIALERDDFATVTPVGIPGEARVQSLDGIRLADTILPGDRLLTRSGARRVMAVSEIVLPAGSAIVTLPTNVLGGAPANDLWLPVSQQILLSDWRAWTLYRQAQVCVPAGQLADGVHMRVETSEIERRCYQLSFDRPEILYADGVQVTSADPLPVG